MKTDRDISDALHAQIKAQVLPCDGWRRMPRCDISATRLTRSPHA